MISDLIVLSGLVPLSSIHHHFGGQLVDKLVVSSMDKKCQKPANELKRPIKTNLNG
jgi:hypothetical protein